MFRHLLIVFLLLPILARGQSVTIGQGSYGGTNEYGPMYAISTSDTAFSRQAYIYPASVLTGLAHGDSISSLDFYAQADQAMTGTVNLRIYLKMTRLDTFAAGSLNFINEINSSGVVLVYDDNPAKLMDGSSGYKNFQFNVNKFRFDTSGKKYNLEFIFHYTQFTRQPSGTYWLYENNFSVSAFKSINEGKINFGPLRNRDTSRLSNIRKPHVRINFPRYNQNLEVLKTYALGKVPLLAGVNDSVKVLIGNRGKRSVSRAKLYLTISGANTHSDSVSVGNINPWEEKLVSFGRFKPDSSGEDNLFVALSSDDFNGNNHDTLKRQINYNVFSHTDPYLGNAGGIGFNGSTGDFVAKFYTDTGIYINQISVDFSASGRGFRAGIWDDNGTGGFPGTVLFMSDSLTSRGGTYILPVLPRVKVSGGFYVGIRQNTPTNVAFSFQDEDPIRPGAFYFTAPMGNTSWTPFSPGFPFKFNIQPRIQVADDVAPLSIDFPGPNADLDYSLKDSIGPSATIVNYGFKDQSTPFEVECVITNLYNIVEYKSSKYITLNSGQSKKIFFDTAFKLYNLGNHRITVTTKLKGDKITDNNTLSQLFSVSVKHDLAADILFAPVDGGIYEYKKDTIVPTVRINNIGSVAKTNFKVIFRIKNDTSVIHTESLTMSLPAGKQEIISFSKYVPKSIGDYIAECFVSIKDSIPFNDTVRGKVVFQKSDDIAVKTIDAPLATGVYTMGGFFFPKTTIVNKGMRNQLTPFLTHCYVYDTGNNLFFYDTVATQLGGYSETQLTFKRCNLPNVYGTYRVVFRTDLKNDQEPGNDSMQGIFTIIPNRDLTLLKVLVPAHDTLILSENVPFRPSVMLKNLGSLTLSNPGKVHMRIFRNAVLMYADSVNVSGNLSYNSNLTVALSGDFVMPTPGDYTLRTFCKLPGDLIRSNDTLESRFKIARNFDLSIDSISNFANGQQFMYSNQFFKPQLLIKNNGAKNYALPFNLKLDLFKDTLKIASRNYRFDSIPRSFTEVIFADSLIHLRQTGAFTLCADVQAALDLNTGNNRYCWNFEILKPRDLQLDSILFPDKNNYCYHNITYRPRLKATNLGTEPIVNTLIDFKIYETTNYIWTQNRYIDLNPGQSKWILFDSSLEFTFTGTAKAQAVSYLSGDLEKSNDTTVRPFNIALVSSISHVNPEFTALYPNPTVDKITFITGFTGTHRIVISNPEGKLLVDKHFIPHRNQIDLYLEQEYGLKPGIYILRCENGQSNKSFRVVLLRAE